MNKKRKIPNFKSLKEEAKFWETHSLADYWADFENVKLVVSLEKPKEETLVLRIQRSLKDRLEKLAKTEGISTSSLVRMWLTEKLTS